MRFGVRGRIFLFTLAGIVVVGVASGAFLERSLRSWLELRIENDLTRSAAAARDVIELGPEASSVPRMDPLADRLGRTTGARITVIAADGRVLGDSERDPLEVEAMADHGDRPEVRAAQRDGRGVSRRRSATLGIDMLYLAVPYRRGEAAGVVRAALPLYEVEGVIGRLRVFFLIAALLGLAAAVAISGLTSQLASRSLRKLVARARTAAQAGGGRRIEVAAEDDLGSLAGSFNRVATELERAVTALTEERDRLGRILGALGEAVVAVDAERRVTLMNPAALELLGLDEVPEGRLLIETVRLPALNELVGACERGTTREHEFDVPGDPPRRLLARAAPLQATGGAVVVMHDVTEIRRLETVRRDFVANVSHELRTPVSVILANAETLRAGALEEPGPARTFVEAIGRNAERLSHVIADLLDLSRLEAGRYVFSSGDIEVAPVAERVLATLAEAARAKGMTARSAVGGGVRVRADAGALEQILVNLVDNAIKHTPEGGRIEIAAETRDGVVRVEVRDDGAGIEPAQRERIFERFYRLDPGRSREMGGTGLGLSIVRHLAEAMGGRAGVDGGSPRGSVFWFTLPAP